jgi:hypothetical protein
MYEFDCPSSTLVTIGSEKRRREEEFETDATDATQRGYSE